MNGKCAARETGSTLVRYQYMSVCTHVQKVCAMGYFEKVLLKCHELAESNSIL